MLPHNDGFLLATAIFIQNANPILDTREYEVEFLDGATDVFTANTIAENLYSQVDDEGNSYSIMSEIIDHKKDGAAVAKDDGFEITKSGLKRRSANNKRMEASCFVEGWKLNLGSSQRLEGVQPCRSR